MTAPEVGKLISEKAFRDAIHVAIAPVTAGVRLFPGQHVGLKNGEAHVDGPLIGVVDPFLTKQVQPGEMFWLFLYPNTVTSLRHAWTHPAFAAAATTPKQEANDANNAPGVS